jgi:hypothetical protein
MISIFFFLLLHPIPLPPLKSTVADPNRIYLDADPQFFSDSDADSNSDSIYVNLDTNHSKVSSKFPSSTVGTLFYA